MKKYNTLFVVTITILLIGLLTWILPITYLSGEMVSAERSQAGIMNMFNYPVFTFYNFIYVFIYLTAIGGFYSLLNKTGAYRLILDRVVKFVKKLEILWLIVTVVLIAVIVSFTGLTFEVLIILPFIASVVLLLGYDKITAAMLTVGSISIGVIGTTFSIMVAGTFNEILSTSYTDLIWVKVALLVLCVAILIINIIWYAKKLEKTKNVTEEFLIPAKVRDSKIKVWPLATLLIVFLLVMILSTINWSEAFGITFFETLLSNISLGSVLSRYVVLTIGLLVVIYNLLFSFIQRKKAAKKNEKFMTKRRLIVTIVFGVIAFLALLKIMLEDVFGATKIMSDALTAIKVDTLIKEFTWGKLLGSVQAFGNWTYNEFICVILMMGIIIKYAYHITFDDAITEFGQGIKKVLYGALVVLLAYTVLILTSSHPVILTILKPLLQLTDGLSILWYPICTFVSALCNTDFTYYKYGVLSLSYATAYFTSANIYPLCGLITQTMYGLALMVAPTSSVLLFSLSLLDIKYTTWFKKMWKPILEIVFILFVSYIVVLQFMV